MKNLACLGSVIINLQTYKIVIRHKLRLTIGRHAHYINLTHIDGIVPHEEFATEQILNNVVRHAQHLTFEIVGRSKTINTNARRTEQYIIGFYNILPTSNNQCCTARSTHYDKIAN